MVTKKERRGLLTAALRSGEFAQADGYLRTDEGYCCLGVACEIFRRETDTGDWNDDNEFVIGDDRSYAVLPEPVRSWFGFKSHRGLMDSRQTVLDVLDEEDGDVPTDDLTELNDYGISFGKIADVIDAEPAGLVSSYD